MYTNFLRMPYLLNWPQFKTQKCRAWIFDPRATILKDGILLEFSKPCKICSQPIKDRETCDEYGSLNDHPCHRVTEIIYLGNTDYFHGNMEFSYKLSQ